MKWKPRRNTSIWGSRWRDRQSQVVATYWLTALLLFLLFLLLVALACTLPSPQPDLSPDIFMAVSYSGMVSKVEAGQVAAVHLEGTALNGLLFSARSQVDNYSASMQRVNTMGRQAEMNSDVAIFLGCIPSVSPACFNENGEPRFPRARLIFTFVPEQQVTWLVTLLLSRHVVVSSIRPYTPPFWGSLIWKVGPLWLLFLFILFTDWPPPARRLRW